MPDIKLLDKNVAELIAAGEVIEKPASVIKELVENSIDAGAKHITVEIKNGGISYMRITDDGCGIAYDQLPTAFLRHATSKIRSGDDLYSIGTMGFRGEALASVAAVGKVEMLTRQAEDELGGRYEIDGGEEKVYEQCGCPMGTTIIIRDLFFNTPARLKFLKKDVSEGNFIAAAVDKLALSNPDISFRFIRDNKCVRITAGDGSLYGAVKAVYGRQIADSFIPVNNSWGGIEVNGFISSPLFCRASRNMQLFYVNGRYIKSTTCMAAVEEAYRNSIMTGKFPGCVLNIKLPPDKIDVNVHPAKTEIKFSQEKAVFDAVYLAAKNALLSNTSERRQIELDRKPTAAYKSADSYFAVNPEKIEMRQQPLGAASEPKAAETTVQSSPNIKADIQQLYPKAVQKPQVLNSTRAQYNASAEKESADDKNEASFFGTPVHITNKSVVVEVDDEDFSETSSVSAVPEKSVEIAVPSDKKQDNTEDNTAEYKYINEPLVHIYADKVQTVAAITEDKTVEKPLRVIGEFSATYIICEAGDELIIIDKHAAHERIRFEKLKSEFVSTSQLLLDKTELTLSAEEYNALQEYYEYVEQTGVELVFEDDCKVLVTAMPSVIKCTPQELIADIAQRLLTHSTEQTGALFDDMLHTMACKSAIKANDRTDITELQALADIVWKDDRIRFCPHGRPVMTSLSKGRIERFFNRS